MLRQFCKQFQKSVFLGGKISSKRQVVLSQKHIRPCSGDSFPGADAPLTWKETDLPFLRESPLEFFHDNRDPVQVWIDTLSTIENKKLGLMELHPRIWSAFPRIDLIHKNIIWQQKYRKVNHGFEKNRYEMRGGGRKPWPQKKTGRARHGSRRSPLFLKGGKAHGQRGPTSYYFMLPEHIRIHGLRSMLSIKLAQNNLVLVDSLSISSDSPQYLENIAKERGWGQSVLFVDIDAFMPLNISFAVENLKGFTLMPSFGLNVYSMLKHETLVLTTRAALDIETKLLRLLNSLVVRTYRNPGIGGSNHPWLKIPNKLNHPA